MDETRSGRVGQAKGLSDNGHATRGSAITCRLAEKSQKASCGVRLVVVPVSLRLWSMFEEWTHVGEQARRFMEQLIAMYKQMASSSIGAWRPLELILAIRKAGIRCHYAVHLPSVAHAVSYTAYESFTKCTTLSAHTHTRVISHSILGTWEVIACALGTRWRSAGKAVQAARFKVHG